MTAVTIRTGTMGWAYDDWRGTFYTRDVKQERMLEQYSRVQGFDTVEIDATFYGAPRKSTLQGWASQVPDNFLFSAKIPRAITHERRLVAAGEAAREFAQLMQQGLGAKLGALLLQLPPEFSSAERDVLESFLQDATSHRYGISGVQWVVEFRHASWQETDIVTALSEQEIWTATTERLDLGGPLRYVRLLGTENSVARFDEVQFDRGSELDTWAKRLLGAENDVSVHIRNFFEGHAPATIASLRERIGLPLSSPPGKQQMSLF